MYASTISSGVMGPPFKVADVNSCLESLIPFWYWLILYLIDLAGSTSTLLNPAIPANSFPNSYSFPLSSNFP